MRAAVTRERSGPFVIESLRDPEPRANEVLVRVAACGVCHTDLHILHGDIPFPFPCVLGHEISGTVLQLGIGVTDLSVGQRVAAAFIMPCGKCAMCRADREELCEQFFVHNRLNGTLYDGETRLFDESGEPVFMYSMAGLSEQAVMPAGAVVPLPSEINLNDAAIFGCALMTAFGAVSDVGRLSPGEQVAVIGAGGVGGSLIQVARALGAGRIIAIDVSAQKLELARQLGATDAIDATQQDPVDAVRQIAGGQGVDIAFEAVGRPDTFRQATELTADGGRCVFVGIARAGLTAEVEITRLVRRKLRLLGSFGASPRRALPALMQLAVDGDLDLSSAIGARFTLDQADHAYSLLASGEILGRAIIEV
jgi:succinate semialdehyde reductase (NADPH)